MAQPKCPNCSREFVRRVAGVGLTERLLGLFYLYPFKCQLCGFRFRFRQRGVRYVRLQEDRREYDRMQVSFPMSFNSDGIEAEGLVLTLSMDGASFDTTAEIHEGMILKLALNISGEASPVIVDAAVVRHVKNHVAGVEFLQWQTAERARLQLFVRGLLIGR